jgi:hypothetical protein
VRLGEWPQPEDDDWDVGVSSVLSLPSYEDAELYGHAFPPMPDDRPLISYDRIPTREVELRRGSAAEAADGTALGHVTNLGATTKVRPDRRNRRPYPPPPSSCWTPAHRYTSRVSLAVRYRRRIGCRADLIESGRCSLGTKAVVRGGSYAEIAQ